MKWDIFSITKSRKKAFEKDEVDLVIEKIEKSAPRKYRSERYLYYYNYRSMGSYTKPLMALLEVAAQWDRSEDQRSVFLYSLFMRLKEFYDIRGRLSMPEALEDLSLMRKLQELFLFFFDGKDTPTTAEIKCLLT